MRQCHHHAELEAEEQAVMLITMDLQQAIRTHIVRHISHTPQSTICPPQDTFHQSRPLFFKMGQEGWNVDEGRRRARELAAMELEDIHNVRLETAPSLLGQF